MQVFGVESLYCRENATKKSASADLSVILIYCLFLFMHQKEQVTSPARRGVICPPMAGEFGTNMFQIYFSSLSIISQWPL